VDGGESMKKTYYEQVPLKVVKKIVAIMETPEPDKDPKPGRAKSGKKP
jgi:hypothetical protein